MSPRVGDLRPPLLPVNEDDHGAWVITVSTILLLLAILATSVTVVSRLRVIRTLCWSDLALVVSCVSGIERVHCLVSNHSHTRSSSYPKLSASTSRAVMELENDLMLSILLLSKHTARYECYFWI